MAKSPSPPSAEPKPEGNSGGKIMNMSARESDDQKLPMWLALLGAGLLGLAHTFPDVNKWTHGTLITAMHGHAAPSTRINESA